MYDWEAFVKASKRFTFIICGRIQMGRQLPNALQGLPLLRGKVGLFFLSLKDSTEVAQVAQCRNGLIYKRCMNIDFRLNS